MYSQDWHPPATPHFAAQGGPWPVHCVRQQLGRRSSTPTSSSAGEVVRKGTGGEDGYSAFTVRRSCDRARRGRRAWTRCCGATASTAVIVVGLATDYCVRRQRPRRPPPPGSPPWSSPSGTRPVDLQPGDGDRALERMAAAGAERRVTGRAARALHRPLRAHDGGVASIRPSGGHEIVTFDLFVRSLPPRREFLVVVRHRHRPRRLGRFRFDAAALDYLAHALACSSDDFLEQLAHVPLRRRGAGRCCRG